MSRGSTPTPRAIERINALAAAPLPAPYLCALIVSAIGRAIEAANVPALYVLESHATPLQDFAVFVGNETMTDELRMLLAAGVWPGPPHAPSPARLATERGLDPIVTVTLWGTQEDGVWSDMWRERNVRHGLYGAFFSPEGRIGIMLTHRENDATPFSEANLAFVKACKEALERALDRDVTIAEHDWTPVETIHIGFDEHGKISALAFHGSEMLRDLGGGCSGAIDQGEAIVESIVADFMRRRGLPPSKVERAVVAGAPAQRPFRNARADLSLALPGGSWRDALPITISQSRFGRFEFWPSILIGKRGEFELAGSLTRHAPSLALKLRGALQVGASAREIELLCAIATEGVLSQAARALGIAEQTAKTLAQRLAARVQARGLTEAAPRLLEIGRRSWP